LLVAFALLALLTVGAGIMRGWRACAAARALLRDFGAAERRSLGNGQKVDLVDASEPIVAVVGGLRPRIVAAKSVLPNVVRRSFGW